MSAKPEPKVDIGMLEERALKEHHVTAADAQAKDLVPPGEVWDEQRQRAIPRGVALEIAQLERPLDLQRHLDDWKKNRETLVAFVKTYLEEASYDAKGYPVPGQVRDFYKIPGAQTKALTKRGAEKLGNLFRYGKATTEVRDKTETKEYVSATVEVTLVDQYRRPVGSAVSSCSTAEGGFASERVKKKYGGDYRAALNDVVARAAKRAFVQAVIVAAAADEVFTAAEDVEGTGESAPAAAKPRFPEKFGNVSGKLVEDVASDALIKIAKWCREKAKNPKALAPILAAVEEELERRRLGADDETPPSDEFQF